MKWAFVFHKKHYVQGPLVPASLEKDVESMDEVQATIQDTKPEEATHSMRVFEFSCSQRKVA